MNRTHRTIFNRRLSIWQVASEITRGASKGGGGRSSTVLALMLSLAAGPAMAAVIDNGATVTVPGTHTSPWDISDQGLTVGWDGTGTLIIKDGASVQTDHTLIALTPAGTGTVTVTGAGSSLTNSNSLFVGAGGTGTLNIENGGSVSSTYTNFAGGSGTLNLNGSVNARGVLATGYVQKGSGATALINWNGGILRATGNEANFFRNLTSTDITIGSDGAFFDSNGYGIGISTDLTGTGGLTKLGAGTLTLTGTSHYDGDTTVSAGTLAISNGGSVSNANGYIGNDTGNTGTMTVTGIGSSWTNSGNVFVGSAGNGTLNIEDGGSVSNGNGTIGRANTGTSTVNVTGGGSSWTNSGSLIVGDSGNGALTIKDGGVVSNANDGYVGSGHTSTATVTVTDTGSSWTNSRDLYVGLGGTGTLDIENGGSVSNLIGFIGSQSDSTGTVNVTGSGSSWTNSGNIFIGSEGSGTLDIENGGTVTNGKGTIGGSNTAIGTVNVTGGGSSWTNSSGLYVGDDGTATLNIKDGSLVSSLNTMLGNSVGSKGTLNLNGTAGARGVLETGYVLKGAGTGAFNWNGGILRATGNETNFLRDFTASGITLGAGGAFIDTQAFTVGIDNLSTTILSGQGGLTKLGSGTLSIAGSNSYAGNTTVSAGILQFDTYNQSATQTLGITASAASTFGKLAVTGAATFAANSKIAVDVASVNTLAQGQILAGVVTAGTLNATTFHVTDNSALFNFAASVNGNAVDLNIVQASSTNSGVYDAVMGSGTSSAAGAAHALDAIIAAGATGGDMDAVVTALGQLPTQGAVGHAVAQTLPLLAGGVTQSTLGMLGSFNRTLQERLANPSAGAGSSANTNRANTSGLSGGDDVTNRQAWAKAFGSRADQDGRNGASGFSSDSWGMAFGADGELDRDTRIGVAYAYANSSVNGNTDLSGTKQRAEVDSHLLAVYGRRSLANALQLDWQADIGRNGIDGTRHIDFGGLNRTASSSYTSYSAHVGAGLSKEFVLNAATSIMPGIRADYTWLRDQSYRESGADALNLNVDGNTTEAFVITAEGRVRHALSDRAWLTANLGVGYDTINDRGNIVSTYAGAPGQSFATRGLDHSPWIVSGGIGYTMQVTQGTQVSLRYDAEGRDDYLNQTASVKANWQF